MKNISIIGNTSIDTIKNIDGKIVEKQGGAGYFMSLASVLCGGNVELFTGYGNDFSLLNHERLKVNNLGNSTKRFYIDEVNKIISMEGEQEIGIEKIVTTGHLHISLRKGIKNPIGTLQKSSYKSASVDLMYTSIDEKIGELEQAIPYLDYIFLNKSEYISLRQKVDFFGINGNLTLFITNSDKGITLLSKNDNVYIDKKCQSNKTLKSCIGGGDFFAGAVLGLISIGLDNKDACNLASKFSTAILENGSIERVFQDIELITNLNLFIIGPSGAGKTHFTEVIKSQKKVNLYNDVFPLKEIFMIDQMKGKLSAEEFDQLVYCKEYCKKIITSKLSPFSSFNGDGYDIVNPEAWNYILSVLLDKINLKKGINLIEFSRGYDPTHIAKYKYQKKDVYRFFFDFIQNYFKKQKIKNRPAFIFLEANLNTRINRNIQRKKEGKHYVSQKTMEEVYPESFKPINNNLSELNGMDYTLYTVHNQDKEYDLSLLQEYYKIIILEKLHTFLCNSQ